MELTDPKLIVGICYKLIFTQNTIIYVWAGDLLTTEVMDELNQSNLSLQQMSQTKPDIINLCQLDRLLLTDTYHTYQLSFLPETLEVDDNMRTVKHKIAKYLQFPPFTQYVYSSDLNQILGHHLITKSQKNTH